MATFHITLSEPLLDEEQRQGFDDYCMEKVQEAIDQNEWIAEQEFWQLVEEDAHTRRNARKLEAVS